MFGPLGYPEVMMILLIVLLLFGPDKLPEIAKLIGKAVGELKKNIDQAKSTIEAEIQGTKLEEELLAIKNEVTEINIDESVSSTFNINKEIKQISESAKINNGKK